MAIDKIIPRFLVSDEDERLLKEGAMTDALNVTISEDGDGTEGVIKNVKGTTQGTAVSGSELPVDAVTVIGQVSDPQRGFIYFFVADDNGSTEHAIYQYDTSTNNYKLLVKSSNLAFNKAYPIKADVVNGAFQQDGVIQTILYFTDNLNPPRKINVDRALAGEYLFTASSTFDYSLTTIRASLNSCPTIRFETDTSITQNEFLNDYFQFATQLIYTDGEESAISPYSELAVPSSVFQKTAETSSRSRVFENVCVIRPLYARSEGTSDPDGFNIDFLKTQPFSGVPDVKYIRLLARRGNTGSFFIIDDLPVNSNKTRRVSDEVKTVWDYVAGEYRFYNDNLKIFVGSELANKMYDNVPKKAIGQALAGNRLFYSGYTEGYPNGGLNGEEVKAKFSQKFYSPGTELGTATQGVVVDEGGTTSNGDILLDLSKQFSWPNGQTATDTVDSGTKINIDFNYSPEGTVKGVTTSGISSVYLYDSNDDSFVVGLCPSDQNATFAIGYNGSAQVDLEMPINLTYTLPQDQTLAEVTNSLKEIFNNIERTVEYDYNNNLGLGVFFVTDALNSSIVSNGDTVSFTSAKVKITYGFDDILDTFTTDTQFVVKPYIKRISFTDLYLLGNNVPFYPEVMPGIDSLVDEFQTMNIHSTPLSQNDHAYSISNTTAYIQNLQIFANTTASMSSFKAGCSHDFGVVYYDKWNRSGFVNEIGSVYVKPLSQRSSGEEGRCEITISMESEPPSWAAKWQVVYGGINSFSDYFQYTTGGAFPIRDDSHNIDTSRKRLYVSLKTLDNYTEEKSSLRNYSFTPGDILRVVSYVDDSGTTIYPSSNDPNKPIEFNVVDTVILGNTHDDNPIHPAGHTGQTIDEKYTGTFLILDPVEVNSGVTIVDSSGNSTGLKYVGFDWHSVAEAYDSNNSISAPYPDGTAATAANYWGQRTVIEILTPSKSSEEKVYYEIGEARDVYTVGSEPLKVPKWNNAHGPSVTTRNGDTWLRVVSCKTPLLSDPVANDWDSVNLSGTGDGYVHDLSNWDYLDLVLESLQIDDFEYTKEWHRGRPHVAYKNAAEIKRLNGITYSDPYAEDVANLSLSSFNPSLGNFDSLDGRYGTVEYIGNYNDDLVALQENKLCLIPVNKNILEYASGSADVAVSTNVLGQRRYSAGDYGSGGHPEAVLIQDSSVYFVDESRQAVCALTGGQLVPISDKGMSSFFEDFFATGATKYVSGYDPRDNTYYITRRGTNEDTVGYDAARGVWQSRYSFIPDTYANQNNMLYSFKYVSLPSPVDLRLIIHKHSSSTRNSFYANSYPSTVTVYSKMSPSRVKVFNAISYEGSSATWDMSPGMSTDLGQLSGTITSWQEREGSYYSSMPRNTNTSSIGTRIEEIYIGNLTLVPGSVSTYSSNIRLNRLSIPTGASVTNIKVNDAPQTVSSYTSNQITFDSLLTGSLSNVKLIITHDLKNAGDDPMRGHWAKITLTNSTSSKHELYCINTHITDSKSHHPLGQ